MYHKYNFGDVLAASTRANWQIEDVIPQGAKLDFSRDFMPDSLARTRAADMLSADEQRTLNHIRGHEYLTIFGLVEEFILPFLIDHARPQLRDDDLRIRALLQFAGEEAKHIQLFKVFHKRFTDGFATPCDVIGPPEAIAAEVLRHEPLSVALLILQIEWMTQAHYVGSVKDDGSLDPLFTSLLKHHWMEESQHAKLDTLVVDALAEGRDEAAILQAIDGYLELGTFFDNGFKAQSEMNLAALEKTTGRTLPPAEREALASAQHQAMRWTYLGSGMTHPNFKATLAALSPKAHDRIAEIAPNFC